MNSWRRGHSPATVYIAISCETITLSWALRADTLALVEDRMSLR